MKIDLETFLIICDLYKHIPPRTPNRLDVILHFGKEILTASVSNTQNVGYQKSKPIIIKLHDEEDGDDTDFNLDLDNLARLSQNVVALEHAASGIERAYHKMLLPSEIVCCEQNLNIVSTYA